MNKNQALLEAQKTWERECYQRLKAEYEQDEKRKGKLSCAFGFGLSGHYLSGKKKVMVVGQEANGHTFEYDEWGLENWQKWAVGYLDFQLRGEPSEEYRFSKNNSPFWQFLRKLQAEGMEPCWNNLDKVRRYIRLEGKEWAERKLPYRNPGEQANRERTLLNERIFDGKSKSLLQKEIEIAEPDLVIFAVGPHDPYYHTLCDAFLGQGAYEELNDPKYYPTAGNVAVEISQKIGLNIPAYYTYHPNYLQMKGKLGDVVKILARDLQEK